MSGRSVQLSCQQCQTRKIKCNKSVPCSACTDSGRQCQPVHRGRLPRGRNTKKSVAKPNDLKERITRLEDAVASLRDGQANTVTSGRLTESLSESDRVAPEFWQNLSTIVTDLHALIADESGSSDHNEEAGIKEDWTQSLSLLPLQDRGGRTLRQDHECISVDLEIRLLAVYEERFAPFCRVLDAPVTSSKFHNNLKGKRSEHVEELGAIKTAVLFAAITTLMPHELPDKQSLTEQLKSSIEGLLVDMDLLTSRSFLLLQAFVIYLTALRATKENGRQWALLPLAIRIASLHGLPPAASMCDASKVRLWFCIGMLDLQSAFDHGSRPLLQAHDFEAEPVDIDGPDCARSSSSSEMHGRSFTTMTTSLLTYQAMMCQRRLTANSVLAEQTRETPEVWWRNQERIIADFEHYVGNVAVICGGNNSSVDLQAFTMAIAPESLLNMRLLQHRPLNRLSRQYRPPPSSFNVLQGAVDVLSSAAFKAKAAYAKWAWNSWVKWYALAIALTELCQEPTPWSQEACSSWEVVSNSFHNYANLVVSTRGNLLWRPIARLFKWTLQLRLKQMPKSTEFDRQCQQNPDNAEEQPFPGFSDIPYPVGSIEDLLSHELALESYQFLNTTATHGASPATSLEQTQATEWDVFIQDVLDPTFFADSLQTKQWNGLAPKREEAVKALRSLSVYQSISHVARPLTLERASL